MGAFDPTYPLYPVACILAAVMLLLVMLTSFIRQSFNLGVAFLCIWLFLENIAGAVNTVLWSGNADLRLYAYCDVGPWVLLHSPSLRFDSSSSLASMRLLLCREAYLDTDNHSSAVSDCQLAVCRFT